MVLQTMPSPGPLQQASPAGLGCGCAPCAQSACPTRLALTCRHHGRQQAASGNTQLAGSSFSYRLRPLSDAARMSVACSSGCSSGSPQQPLHLHAARSISLEVGPFQGHLSWQFQWSAASSQPAEGASQPALHFLVTLPHGLWECHAPCMDALLILVDIGAHSMLAPADAPATVACGCLSHPAMQRPGDAEDPLQLAVATMPATHMCCPWLCL